MAFIDEINFHAEAGRGGDGVVRWRQEKFVPKGGPSGGDGGRGGDFHVLAVRDVGILSNYTAKKEFAAGRGEDGGNNSLHGKRGEDFVLRLPVGSVITNISGEERFTLEKEGEKVKLLSGGAGGRGNEHFKSSTNTTPKESTPGKDGDRADFQVELELFADLGLIGLPNAGKSSLLNILTHAHSKVGAYPFTTLEPHLGNFFGYILADIPGLIEGASKGRGLGVKFLRHIRRTQVLGHLVSFENLSRGAKDMILAYQEIRQELQNYDKGLKEEDRHLSDKREIIILTKSDLVEDSSSLKKCLEEFQKMGKEVFILSLYDDKLIKDFQSDLINVLRKNV